MALLAAYNEERFIGGCLDHLIEHGVEAYLIDNSSTDRTVEIAERYLRSGLIGIETLPRSEGIHRWKVILKRKEELAASIEADWFMHMDPDEIRLPPRPEQTLAEAFAEVDEAGYNAVNFLEYTFIPTRESPEHDHPDFQKTMRWYYPLLKHFPNQMKAWKRQTKISLAQSGGHKAQFPGVCMYPEPFKMKHYQFLSLEQARITYLEKKRYAEGDPIGNTWRGRVIEERMGLPSESELNYYTSDGELSLFRPRTRHVMEDWALPEADREDPARSDDSTSPADPPERAAASTDSEGSRSISPGEGRLIIAGFHRSGTSLTAQLLHRAGMFLGYQMLGQHRSNRHGHFEDREIVGLHDEVLADNGLSWQIDGTSLPVLGEAHRRRMEKISARRDAEYRVWGFKDPRVCMFLEDWKALLPDAKVLLVYRHFADAAHSLHRRSAAGLVHGTGQQYLHRRFLEVPDLALKMWLMHNRALLDFARAHPEDVLAVSQEMLARGFPLVETLDENWGLGLGEAQTAEVFDATATGGTDARLLVAEEDLIGEVLATWEELEKLGGKTAELAGRSVASGRQATEEDFQRAPGTYAMLMENEFLKHKVDALQKSAEEREAARKQKRRKANKAGNGSASIRQALPPSSKKPLLGAEDDLLFVYPQAGHAFYEDLAWRLFEARRETSPNVAICSASEVSRMEKNHLRGSSVAVIAPAQCYGRLPDRDGLTRRLSEAQKRIMVLAEGAQTKWFDNQFRLPTRFDALIDFGFVSQEAALQNLEIPYALLFNAPTSEERRNIEQASSSGREVPWAMVGHSRDGRVQLADRLMRGFDPGGFVFLPPPRTIVREGKGMVSPRSLDKLLRNTRFYIWQALHEFAYYESFRFREAILAGAVPCKIDSQPDRWEGSGIPGIYSSVEEFAEAAREEGFEAMRHAAMDFYLSQGLLADHLEGVLEGVWRTA